MNKLLVKYVEDKSNLMSEILWKDVSEVAGYAGRSFKQVIIEQCKANGIKTVGQLLASKKSITSMFFPNEMVVCQAVSSFLKAECEEYYIIRNFKQAKEYIKEYVRDRAFLDLIQNDIDQLKLSKSLTEKLKAHNFCTIQKLMILSRGGFNLQGLSLEEKYEILQALGKFHLNKGREPISAGAFRAEVDRKIGFDYEQECKKLSKYTKEDFLKIKNAFEVPEVHREKYVDYVGEEITREQHKGILRTKENASPKGVTYNVEPEGNCGEKEEIIFYVTENMEEVKNLTEAFRKEHRRELIKRIMKNNSKTADERATAIQNLYDEEIEAE